ncbi:MAG TPA: hypothetical protein ENJ53_01230 [Phaeodactylibacter sp.]|nr:hypothetical protein [Phaeodactylibacter sp.]
MKIYRISTGKPLFQFGDSIGNVPILGRALREWQDQIAKRYGFSIIDVLEKKRVEEEEYLVFSENLFFTDLFFKNILKAISSTHTSLRFCLKNNDFNSRFILPFSLEATKDFFFDFKFIKKNQAVEDFFISQKVYDFEVKLPDQIVKGRSYPMNQCDCFAAHIISPFHLLQVNIAVNLNRTIRIQKGKINEYLKHWKGKIGTFFFYKTLKKLNQVGKNCFIHPSAIIEGSVIGDNVQIGANAVVRLSHVGDNVSISDNVVIANSVLGKSTYISNNNYIELCMTYEETFLIHGPYQFSIFGKNSACFAVINCDYRLDQQSIKIPTDIGIVDSRQPLLGIAYGHRSKTGGGSIIAAGRIVPNDYHINPPDSIHLKFDS